MSMLMFCTGIVCIVHLCQEWILGLGPFVWRRKKSAIFCAASAPAGPPRTGESVATQAVTRSPMNISTGGTMSRERRKPALNAALYEDAHSAIPLVTTAG